MKAIVNGQVCTQVFGHAHLPEVCPTEGQVFPKVCPTEGQFFPKVFPNRASSSPKCTPQRASFSGGCRQYSYRPFQVQTIRY